MMSELLPSITQDEIDNEGTPDSDGDLRRDAEIKGDKPPHHG